MKETVRKLFKLFNKREKRKFILLFAMMIAAALLETLGIGLIVPLAGILTSPDIIQENDILSWIYHTLHFQSTASFIIFSVAMLIAVFIFKNLYLILFHYAQYKVIFNQQVKLSRRLFQEYLSKPYSFHLQRNSAELLRNVNAEVPKVFQGIMMSAFQLLTELLVIICILTLLVITAPLATLAASVLLGGSVLLFFKTFKRKISKLGEQQQKVGGEMIRWVNQGLGANKEVKVSGREEFFINSYASQSQIQANNNRYMKILEKVPHVFIETLLVSIILLTMLIIILQSSNPAELVAIMALFSMAAFRLMPSINRVINMITAIKYSLPALEVIYDDLIENGTGEDVIKKGTVSIINGDNRTFQNAINLEKISYRYPEQKDFAIKHVSLTIPIGRSVAFVGESGSGKTTLVDIILGILQPQDGHVLVDGRKLKDLKGIWQQKIGYIPQFIFLSDDTIRNNVAFGLDKSQISEQEIWRALEQAQLKEFVNSLPEKLNTKVGERGVKLSGGQRQRIGIARALYHNPEILFMDEATSALDNETEREIMKSIEILKGHKTLIIIAHRLSTIEKCDTVFEIKAGKLVATHERLHEEGVIEVN